MAASSGHIAIVTGSASGIGLAIARAFHAGGDRVVLGDLRQDALDAALATFAHADAELARVHAVAVDVRDEAAVTNLVAETERAFGPPTVMVANAGIVPNAPVLDMELAMWDACIETNLRGVFLSCRAAARSMVAHGIRGRIVTTSSIADHVGRPGAAAYCASKAGVVMLTKVLAMELAEHGITVNAVSPGVIEVRDNPTWAESPFGSAIMAALPAGRRGRPDEVAHAVRFLCSPEAEFISGAVLPIDGAMDTGWTHMPYSGVRG